MVAQTRPFRMGDFNRVFIPDFPASARVESHVQHIVFSFGSKYPWTGEKNRLQYRAIDSPSGEACGAIGRPSDVEVR